MNNQFLDMDESITIPKDHYVVHCDFDAEEPFCVICPKNEVGDRKILVPKALAYYLTTHFCGSNKMRDLYKRQARNEMRRKLSEILGYEMLQNE
jgi:hypothetical protein